MASRTAEVLCKRRKEHDFVSDMHKSNIVDFCLSVVVAETFIDSYAISEKCRLRAAIHVLGRHQSIHRTLCQAAKRAYLKNLLLSDYLLNILTRATSEVRALLCFIK